MSLQKYIIRDGFGIYIELMLEIHRVRNNIKSKNKTDMLES